MVVEHINYEDNMRQGTDKLNKSIDQSNEAIDKANSAVNTSNSAKSKADSIQMQLDTIVVKGDSSVEAAQARLDVNNFVHDTLKKRLDEDFQKNATEITNYKNVTGVSIDSFPRILPEVNDTGRVQRAYDALGTAGGFIRFGAKNYIFNLEILKSNVFISGLGQNVTFFKPADIARPVIKIGNGVVDITRFGLFHFSMTGGSGSAPINQPNSDGLVIDGVTFVMIGHTNIEYFGGDNVRITSSGTRGTSYIFFSDFQSRYAYGNCLKMSYGSAWTTAVYIDNFSIIGNNNTGSRALHLTNVVLYLNNGWITCNNGVGNIYLNPSSRSTKITGDNVAIDSSNSSNVLIETTGTEKRLGKFIEGKITINGKWNRNGTVGTYTYTDGGSIPSDSRLSYPIIVDALKFANINATDPDDKNSAVQLYRDGERLRWFGDPNFSSGLWMSNFSSTPPSSATSNGNPGYWSADANYLYICFAVNSWRRVALSTW